MYNKFLEYLLDDAPEKVVSKSGIIIRKLYHPAFLLAAKLATKSKLHIVRRESVPKGRKIIYAPCHGFVDDI